MTASAVHGQPAILTELVPKVLFRLVFWGHLRGLRPVDKCDFKFNYYDLTSARRSAWHARRFKCNHGRVSGRANWIPR